MSLEEVFLHLTTEDTAAPAPDSPPAAGLEEEADHE